MKFKYILGIIGLILPLVALIPNFGVFIFIILNPIASFVIALTTWHCQWATTECSQLLVWPLNAFISFIFYIPIGYAIDKIKKDSIHRTVYPLIVYIAINLVALWLFFYEMSNIS